MPTKVIKNNCDIFKKFFQANFNNPIETSTLPEQLKYGDVKAVFFRNFQFDKNSYEPISIIPSVSKIYPRYLNKQLKKYFQALLPKYQSVFRKNYSVINALLSKTENWRKSINEGGAIEVLFTDLSKTFNCSSLNFMLMG